MFKLRSHNGVLGGCGNLLDGYGICYTCGIRPAEVYIGINYFTYSTVAKWVEMGATFKTSDFEVVNNDTIERLIMLQNINKDKVDE